MSKLIEKFLPLKFLFLAFKSFTISTSETFSNWNYIEKIETS